MLNDLVKKYKDNLESRDNMYEQIKIEKIKQAKKENEERREKLKSEENSNVTDITEENISNLNNLRDIVNESDSLFYENMKKNAEEAPQEPDMVSSAESLEAQPKPDLFEPSPVIVEDMSRLQDEDPWMKRKKEMNA
jgi:hypothetical protein